MAEVLRWEPDWEVSVEEVSAGVYKVAAVSATMGTLETTSADPDDALKQVEPGQPHVFLTPLRRTRSGVPCGPVKPDLDQRLREQRYRRAADAGSRVLDGIGIGEREVLSASETDEQWVRYVEKLRPSGDHRTTWRAYETDEIGKRIATLARRIGERKVVWFFLTGDERVGFEVLAEPLLDASLSHLVTRAGDLMLTSRDCSDGICVELNDLPAGREYEITSWGDFIVDE